jgi:hypothetical protein
MLRFVTFNTATVSGFAMQQLLLRNTYAHAANLNEYPLIVGWLTATADPMSPHHAVRANTKV